MTMREIPVSGGRVTLVDETDYPLVAHLSWHARRGRTTTYAVHSDWDGAARRNRDTYMHRLILGASPSVHVDHRNGNGLDNRRANLREATPSQNQQNKIRLSRNTSGYRGVTLHKRTGKWQATIGHQRRFLYLGLFATPEEAAKAYDTAALRLFGEFARPNLPHAEATP
jgi:hypothetical protein